ncbi:MAG: hydroxypyruvate isomerase [Rhodospirillales bacterium]
MPRFAANLSMLFPERPFADRFGAAARAGFRAVECQFPYELSAETLADRLAAHGLSMVLHNLPAGDWAAGERGLACRPDRRDDFQTGLEQAIAYANRLNCPTLNCLAGLRPSDLDPAEATATLVANLKLAATELKKAGIALVVEAINTRDVPGFFLNCTDQALALIEAVGADNLFVQYDAYHMQIMEGDLAPTLSRLKDRGLLRHVQIADTPGRFEPGTGEINFPFLFGHLDRIGYDGWVGCEYRPAGATLAGLEWLAPYQPTLKVPA